MTTEACLGNRGPEFNETAYPALGKYTLKAGATGKESNTLLIHGSRSGWEGCIGYNDGRVAFEQRADPEGLTYRRTGTTTPLTVPDNLFIDETDDAAGQNSKGSHGDIGKDLNINSFLRSIKGVSGEESTYSVDLWIDGSSS